MTLHWAYLFFQNLLDPFIKCQFMCRLEVLDEEPGDDEEGGGQR